MLLFRNLHVRAAGTSKVCLILIGMKANEVATKDTIKQLFLDREASPEVICWERSVQEKSYRTSFVLRM